MKPYFLQTNLDQVVRIYCHYMQNMQKLSSFNPKQIRIWHRASIHAKNLDGNLRGKIFPNHNRYIYQSALVFKFMFNILQKELYQHLDNLDVIW
jgi:hypothetical protein